MGGKGSGRPTKEQQIVRKLSGNNSTMIPKQDKEIRTPIASGMYLPNLSGGSKNLDMTNWLNSAYLAIDGSNANQNIHIGAYDFATTGSISASNGITGNTLTAYEDANAWAWLQQSTFGGGEPDGTGTGLRIVYNGLVNGIDIWNTGDQKLNFRSTGGSASPITLNITGSIDASSSVSAGNMTIGSGSITDSSGSISFNDENLTTTGKVTAGDLEVVNATGGIIKVSDTAANTYLELFSGNSGVSRAHINTGTGSHSLDMGTAGNTYMTIAADKIEMFSSNPLIESRQISFTDPGLSSDIMSIGCKVDGSNYRNFFGAKTTGTNNQSVLYIGHSASTANVQNVYINGRSDLLIGTIDTAMNVGIGTASPAAKLDVEGDIYPATDDTYYLGKNDDDTPKAWKGIILKDTTDGKYYRIQVTNGAVEAIDLTD